MRCVHVSSAGSTPPTFTTRSGRDGSFVAWAMAGDIQVAASAEGHVDGSAIAVAPIAGLEVMLTPESTLSGIVVEAGTRRPLDDATVEIPPVGNVHTDAAGRFRVGKLPPGRYKPTASSIGGYGEAAESVLLGLGQSIDDVVIEIHPVAVVAGRISIDDGASSRPCPAGDGEVWLRRYGSQAYYVARPPVMETCCSKAWSPAPTTSP